MATTAKDGPNANFVSTHPHTSLMAVTSMSLITPAEALDLTRALSYLG